MPARKQKKNKKDLADALKKCRISTPKHQNTTTEQFERKSIGMVIHSNESQTISSEYTKTNLKVPPIFLHKPVDFEHHIRKVLLLGVKFYQPYHGRIYTKINCVSFEDHRGLIQYLKSNKLPYHTYGNPMHRKMKVVIRGLPVDTSLIALKEELKSIGIPIVRVHKMHTKESKKVHPLLLLAVAPNSEEGSKLMQVEELLGHKVKMEPPINKTKQCHRCQKWGHSQRYCHGQLRCVKCAGEHITSKCKRNPDNEPPKCANCGGDHTASFKKCSYCPDSADYKRIQTERKRLLTSPPTKLELVTLQNYHDLDKYVLVTKFEEV